MNPATPRLWGCLHCKKVLLDVKVMAIDCCNALASMDHLNEAGDGFRSRAEAIDTTTPAGRMMMLYAK
jgi:hypothetical protein